MLADCFKPNRSNENQANHGRHLLFSPVNIVAVSLFLLIELSIVIWSAFDHSIPCWDTAIHKLNSWRVYELWEHPRFFKLSWYREIFAVSPLYPPLFYFFSAAIKLLLGTTVDSELIVNLIFIAVLFFSVFYIAKTISHRRADGTVAAGLIFLYPAVYRSAHIAILDFAADAMVALGLAFFLWWAKNRSLGRSIALGLVWGLATLTKNNVPIFFVGPLLIDCIQALRNKSNCNLGFNRIKRAFIVVFVCSIVISPWLIAAGPAMFKFITAIQQQQFQLNIYNMKTPADSNNHAVMSNWLSEFGQHLEWFTFHDVVLVLSPLLCICFLLALIGIKPHKSNELYILASTVFGIIIASAFRWPHQFRYIVPIVASAAALTGGMTVRVWSLRVLPLRLIVIMIALLAFLQFIYNNWCPYPMQMPKAMCKIVQMLENNFQMQGSELPGVSAHPLPYRDWGVLWVISQIEKSCGGMPTSLMVIPGSDEVNCSSYYYLAKISKNNIEVATPRQHMEDGDLVDFDSRLAVWYEWYVLKTGEQGRQLFDAKSMANYEKWKAFVTNSGLYKLICTKQLYDGSEMQLYRRQHNQISR